MPNESHNPEATETSAPTSDVGTPVTLNLKVQRREGLTTDEIADKLTEIFIDVQGKIHDRWDWMDASYYVECLRSLAANVCPNCGEAGLGCNQFGCWKAANAPLPAPPWSEQLLKTVVCELTQHASKVASITYEQGIAFGAALAKKGVRIIYDGTGGDTPSHASAEAPIAIGVDGVRDAANSCSEFISGVPHHSSTCEGDGHYLCGQCKNKHATNPGASPDGEQIAVKA